MHKSWKFLHTKTYAGQQKYRCGQWSHGYVPEIIISNLEPIPGLEYIGEPKFIEVKLIKTKRNEKGETNAIHVSEKLFFTEFYLHK